MDTENLPSAPLPEETDDSPSSRLDWKSLWPKLRWVAVRLFAVLGTFLLLLLLLTASAGWYTSRSEFCRSCHIMEPYYQSWRHSSHSDVACIKCHFAPGFNEKVRGKMLGLVQLAKYVTRSEGPRPAAEIPDASCLRSGCHETRLLSGRVEFQGVPFDHQPHLEKLRRDKKLRCTSCHSQIVQGEHMAVTTSTCFLCHFKEGLFNEGLGACTRCHQIPKEKFDIGGGAMFTHELAYEKGVDCINCHGDLIRGNGEVPHERCQVCHNRKDDLSRKDDHVFMHQKHVSDHKVDCLDCHLEIRHSLDRDNVVHAAADCTSCHPDHHREQVDMLRGIGGKSIPAHPTGMQSVRIECRSCHRVKGVSDTGTVLWKASAEVCMSCHDASAAQPQRLELYHQTFQASLDELESGIQRAQEALPTAALDADRSTEVETQLEDLKDDLSFLRAANGIHNIHYASTLIKTLVDRVSSLCRELEIAEPEVSLPQGGEEFK